ncbi:hypothetical protein TRICI_000655 [Trichomonascus ciferrii]|uniref:Uncharacterized protein n=1 Tax=Trichomonascus ciferrii TaxID=44093 RepID=A0A642VCZ7_9ASCO|nr:hypothetical protein TRICI_000655 [Trichomonascus ciferrii]
MGPSGPTTICGTDPNTAYTSGGTTNPYNPETVGTCASDVAYAIEIGICTPSRSGQRAEQTPVATPPPPPDAATPTAWTPCSRRPTSSSPQCWTAAADTAAGPPAAAAASGRPQAVATTATATRPVGSSSTTSCYLSML